MRIDPEHALRVAERAATEAGEEIRKIREGGGPKVSYKGELNLVTSADIAAESIIVNRIKEAFPDHAFLTEEAQPELAPDRTFDEPLWIVDPVDGTTNYAHGHLQVGVSIAFMQNRSVEAAVVHTPFQNETFTALKGHGAKLNGKPIQVSACDSLKRALIATGFPYEREDMRTLLGRIESVLANCRDIRRLGAASVDISWVAMGRLDGFYETLSAWDVAAAFLIAKEAGAKVGFIGGQPSSSKLPADIFPENVVVAPPAIFDPLMELLRSVS